MADADAIVADILSGAYDDELVVLAEALQQRGQDGPEVAWSVRWEGIQVDKTDRNGHGITVRHALRLGEIATDVRNLDPAQRDLHRMAVPISYVMATEGLSLADAEKKIGDLKLDAIEVVEYVEKDVPKGRSTLEPQDG